MFRRTQQETAVVMVTSLYMKKCPPTPGEVFKQIFKKMGEWNQD
jgi:hypothetical protein